MISVVIPTVSGRERLLKQAQESFRKTADVEFIVVRNQETCGKAWNLGVEQASGDYLCLAGDDFLAEPGWAEAAIEASEADIYPAPWIKRTDGETESCGTLGQGLYLKPADDGIPVYNASVPFMRRDLWGVIGPSIETHYYADDYLSYKARFHAGLSVEVCQSYSFIHLDGQPGKARNVIRNDEFRWAYAGAVTELCES